MNPVIPLQQMKHKKSSRNHQYYRQRLTCPVCNFQRLIDTGQHTQSLTYIAGDKEYQTADYYQKCSNCKAEIGIRKIE